MTPKLKTDYRAIWARALDGDADALAIVAKWKRPSPHRSGRLAHRYAAAARKLEAAEAELARAARKWDKLRAQVRRYGNELDKLEGEAE